MRQSSYASLFTPRAVGSMVLVAVIVPMPACNDGGRATSGAVAQPAHEAEPTPSVAEPVVDDEHVGEAAEPRADPRALAPAADTPPRESLTMGDRRSCELPDPTGRSSVMSEQTIEPSWRVELEDWASELHAVGDTLVVHLDGGGLWGLDPSSGNVRWKNQRFPGYAKLVAAGGLIVSYEEAGWSLSALDPSTGKMSWTRSLGGTIFDLTRCLEHRAVVALHRGHVDGGRERTMYASAFDPLDGRLLWSRTVPGSRAGATGGSVLVNRAGAQTPQMVRIDCATSAMTPVSWLDAVIDERPEAQHASVIDAERFEGILVRSSPREWLCFSPVGSSVASCLSPNESYQAPPSDVLVRGDTVYYSVHYISATEGSRPPEPKYIGTITAWTANGEKRWETPREFGHTLVDAGGSLLVHHTRGRVFFMDPETPAVLGCAAMPKGIVQIAVDARRAYVAAAAKEDVHDPPSMVFAVDLPRPGPAAHPSTAVPSVEGAALPPDPSVGGVAFREINSFPVHPKRAMSSGMMGSGVANDVTFVGPGQIAIGGMDNHLAIYDYASGHRTARVKGGNKDLLFVQSCETRWVAAETFQPKVVLFELRGRGFARARTLDGTFVGWLDGCEQLLIAHERRLLMVDAVAGTILAAMDIEPTSGWDHYYARGGRVVVPRNGGFELVEASGETLSSVRSFAVPASIDGTKLTQVRIVDETTVLHEHCSEARCSVELVSFDGETLESWSFDVIGNDRHASHLEISPSGRFILFHRHYLLPWLVDRRAGTKVLIANGSSRDVSGYWGAAFSTDEKTLALAGHPRAHEVMLYEIPAP